MADPHVLHVVTNETWGGASRVVHLLATGRDGETTVLCGPGERLRARLTDDGVPVRVESRLRSASRPVTDLQVAAALSRQIAAVDPDIVHCHSTKAGALGRVAARRAGVPAVFTVHGWGFYAPSNGLFSRVIAVGERLLAGRTAALICVSEHDFEEGRRRGIVDRTDAEVVHNGVPPVDSAAPSPLAAELDGDRPVVGTLGRLAEQKDPLAFLRVARRLAADGVAAETVLIGDGPLLADCRAYRDRHDLDVRLLGFREDAHDLLAGFDVFVLPSRFEGLPLVVLEAMHRGVPVVAYDVGGVAEAVRDGETGYIVERGEERALAERVRELLSDDEGRTAMGDRARERAREAFSAERMRADYERVYRDVRDSR